MKKPWSITTTLRNPERLRDFLYVIKQLDNCKWDSANQIKFQIFLIKERKYGYGSRQFYNDLSKEQVELIDDPTKVISFDESVKIFNAKKYEDPAMRGRQSINPLKKLGFVIIRDGKVHITNLGKLFLKENFDLGEIFLKSFMKWQIPNPDNDEYKIKEGYDIKPFIGTLHLIKKTNERALINGEKEKGISKDEFSLFCPTLINYKDIDSYSDEIISLRKIINGKTKQKQKEIFENYKKEFAGKFLNSSNSTEISKLLNNLKDYGDNAIRYFRLTRFINIRGGGFYIDLEPRRSIEIQKLLSFDNAQSNTFIKKEDYLEYISDISKPESPWENKQILSEIASKLLIEIKQYEKDIVINPKIFSNHNLLNEDSLKIFIDDLRNYRRELQDKENQKKSQNIEQIKKYIKGLENIFKADDKPILLEKLLSLALNALNDALKIKPNYPVGDDNEPTFTAPANLPDIECFYDKFNSICEVTMLTSRDQWFNEGQPVMRHLRDFEKKHNYKNSYCLFIAPRLHRDTVNTFWNAVKYEYEGRKQKIVPLSISNFIDILKILVNLRQNGKLLKHMDIVRLYDNIIEKSDKLSDSNEWIKNIPNIIIEWGKSLYY